MTKEIMDVIAEYGYASVPLLQKQCALSYKQAQTALDELLQEGLVNFSNKLIFTINQNKFYKAYGEFLDEAEYKEEYTGELVADNAKLSKYVIEFYKKALLHVIRSQEVRLIDIAVTYHVNSVITTLAVAWMKKHGYVEQKPNKLAKVLITEKEFFEKFGRIREYKERFEDMYSDAVLLCIKYKSFDRSLIAGNFVASYQQIADFEAWLEQNGYKTNNAEANFERVKEKFFKMCNVVGDIKDLSTVGTISFDDGEDDYDYDKDEMDEEEIRRIIENASKTNPFNESDSEIDLEENKDDADDEIFCKVKEFYQKHFSAVFSKDYPHLGFIKSNRITIIEFRLRVQNGKISIARCGCLLKSGQKLKAQSILAEYENVYIIDDEAVVEFTDANYAGTAMLTLFAVTERITVLRKN